VDRRGRGGRRFGNDVRLVDAKVVECKDVTPAMREIRLRGPAFGVVSSKPAAHVPVEIAIDGGAPALRTYSVWAHDPATASLTLRVVAHTPGGPGSRWASKVTPGERLRIGLPRNRITLHPEAPYHVFVGEETGAIPLLTMVAALPESATTTGILETTEQANELPIPSHSKISWIHRGKASAANSATLLRAVRQLELPPKPGVAYVAGETATCSAIMRHLLHDRGWPRNAVRIQTHWTPGKPGLT
jgi:NADPH-dependent ferric siderophore reductase